MRSFCVRWGRRGAVVIPSFDLVSLYAIGSAHNAQDGSG